MISQIFDLVRCRLKSVGAIKRFAILRPFLARPRLRHIQKQTSLGAIVEAAPPESPTSVHPTEFTPPFRAVTADRITMANRTETIPIAGTLLVACVRHDSHREKPIPRIVFPIRRGTWCMNRKRTARTTRD